VLYRKGEGKETAFSLRTLKKERGKKKNLLFNLTISRPPLA